MSGNEQIAVANRRWSVLGVSGGRIHNAPAVYDEERIRKRSRLIG